MPQEMLHIINIQEGDDYKTALSTLMSVMLTDKTVSMSGSRVFGQPRVREARIFK